MRYRAGLWYIYMHTRHHGTSKMATGLMSDGRLVSLTSRDRNTTLNSADHSATKRAPGELHWRVSTSRHSALYILECISLPWLSVYTRIPDNYYTWRWIFDRKPTRIDDIYNFVTASMRLVRGGGRSRGTNNSIPTSKATVILKQKVTINIIHCRKKNVRILFLLDALSRM